MFAALAQLSYQYSTTGDFFTKGVSLKGGLTIKVLEPTADETKISEILEQEFPKSDIEVRTLSSSGQVLGLAVKIDLDINDLNEIQRFKEVLLEAVPTLTQEQLEENTQAISPQLGSSFFQATFRSMILAFLFMAIVVYLYFKVPIPSVAVILCAFADVTVTMAITNLLGIKISTAGIAAFLMLIGYSVDTDILLTTYLLKARKEDRVHNVYRAFKTGCMMNGTTLVAVTMGILLTMSPDIQQILTIILIGIFADQIMTWVQNAGLMMWYLEWTDRKKEAKNVQA